MIYLYKNAEYSNNLQQRKNENSRFNDNFPHYLVYLLTLVYI